MNIHLHSNEEIEKLKSNPCVLRCSQKSITYTYDFKKRALELYREGVSSKEIWRRMGFDIGTWRKTYPKDCIRDWKDIVEERGLEELVESRGKESTGRRKTKAVTDQDRIKRLELEVKYLQAENSFLAKLRAKRAESNSGQVKNSKSSNS